MSRVPSVKDVAALAGVSVGTVSNALNRPAQVSETTLRRVTAAMEELGYVRNESARQLRAGKSRVLAYVVLDNGNPFFTDVAAGIDDVAAEEGLPVFLCNSAHDAESEASHLDHLRQQRVLGVLITPVDPEAPVLAEVAQQGIPVVIVDRTSDSQTFSSVSVDDVLGGRLAVDHLVELGHERIAFVGGSLEIGQVRARLDGARAAWDEAGRDPDDLDVILTDGLTTAEGRTAWDRLAAVADDRRPTAAFCANDLLAIGLLQQVISSGRSVPDDLAIVGYDDIEFAAAAAVPLSSVRQPRNELGRTAARLVLDEADDPDRAHRQIVFAPELVVRRSTAG